MEAPDDYRIRKSVGSEGKWSDPGIVEPWSELISGSKNLNCGWIFGFVELIVGSGNVGSAAKSVGSAEKSVGSGRKCDAEPCRAVLRPKLLKSGTKDSKD